MQYSSSVRLFVVVPRKVYDFFLTSDCGFWNIMMDATDLYPDGFHPMCQLLDATWTRKPVLAKYYTRTRTPVKYYFIDFGISCVFDPDDTSPIEIPVRAGDKSAPDFEDDSLVPINPFPTDVYYIGNVIRKDIKRVRCLRSCGIDCCNH